VVGQIALMIVNSAAPIWFRSRPGFPLTLVSIFLFAVAAICGLVGTVTLGRNLTPFPHPSSETRLVQKGIYGLIRHPLYSAVLAWSLGWAIFWLSWPSIVAAFLLFPLLDSKARFEEHALLQQFPEYSSYQKRVKRFIPWIY